MNQPTTRIAPQKSILASLRHVIPAREATFTEALHVAELQANKLRQLLGDEWGIHEHHLAALPRLRIIRADIPHSGMSHWNGREWVITLSKHDSLVRQRFTLLHEYKHIIDHGSTHQLYTGTRQRSASQLAELAADYFAGCALVSKRELKSAWGNGIQRPAALATHFGVSESAIRVRLAQTGLDVIADHQPTARCARSFSMPGSPWQRLHDARPTYQRSYA